MGEPFHVMRTRWLSSTEESRSRQARDSRRAAFSSHSSDEPDEERGVSGGVVAGVREEVLGGGVMWRLDEGDGEDNFVPERDEPEVEAKRLVFRLTLPAGPEV